MFFALIFKSKLLTYLISLLLFQFSSIMVPFQFISINLQFPHTSLSTAQSTSLNHGKFPILFDFPHRAIDGSIINCHVSINNAQFALSAIIHQDRTCGLIYWCSWKPCVKFIRWCIFLSGKLQPFGLWRQPGQSLSIYSSPCLELFYKEHEFSVRLGCSNIRC